MIEDFCAQGKISDYSFVDLQQTLVEMDRGMTQTTANFMCTTACPCVATLNKSLWTNETEMRKFGRTLAATDTLTIEKRYKAFVLGGARVYDDFWSCYEYLQSTNQTQGTYYEINESYKGLFEDLEDEFNCNGVCRPGIFYLFKDVVEGPPTKRCLDSAIEYFGRRPIAVGVVLLVSCFLTFITFVISFSLCSCCKKCGGDKSKSHH